ncbi:MAG: polysaccharide deacetylase family protein [Calditrichota bacterium]
MKAEILSHLAPHWLFRLPATMPNGVALTFDDGPHPDTTPRLLSQLDRLGITATHFLIGSQALKFGSLTRDISTSGQAIANHGHHHESYCRHMKRWQLENISAADTAIRTYTDQTPDWFRPPFGRFNPWTAKAAHQTGYQCVLWSLIAGDWLADNETELWSRLRSRLHDRAIIVLHDGHPTTSTMINVLPQLADEVRQRGWTFVTLPSPSTIRS